VDCADDDDATMNSDAPACNAQGEDYTCSGEGSQDITLYEDGSDSGWNVCYEDIGGTSSLQEGLGTEQNHGPAPVYPANGDAKKYFGKTVNFGKISYIATEIDGSYFEVRFTGLNNSKKYTITMCGMRGNYTDRWTEYELLDYGAFTADHSSGVIEGGSPTGKTCRYVAGDNWTNGYVARWKDVTPGGDGDITISCKGVAQGGDSVNKAYLTAFIITEQQVSTNTKTVTCDAYLQQAANTKTLTADAFLSTTETKTLTVDAYLQSVETKTFTTDSILQKVNSKSFDSDSYLMQQNTKTYTSDAYLVKQFTEAFTVDSWLAVRYTKSYTADSILKGTQLKSFTCDSWLGVVYTKNYTADAYLSYQYTKDYTGDAYLQAIQVKSYTADAYLQQTYTKTYTADAKQVTTYCHLRQLIMISFIRCCLLTQMQTLFSLQTPRLQKHFLVTRTYSQRFLQLIHILSLFVPKRTLPTGTLQEHKPRRSQPMHTFKRREQKHLPVMRIFKQPQRRLSHRTPGLRARK